MAVEFGADLQRLARGIEASRQRVQHAAAVAQPGNTLAVEQMSVDARHLRGDVGTHAHAATGYLIDQQLTGGTRNFRFYLVTRGTWTIYANDTAYTYQTATSSPLTANEGNMSLSVNNDAVKSFLINQGLSEEQAADLKIEFGKLRWSNKATRFLASFFPGRFREIFTRIESLKGNTLKIFTNNLDSIYDAGDTDLIARDTIHHLVHFAQRKKGMSRLTHFLTRLPIIHGLSKYEKEARNLANQANLDNEPWADMIQFSSQREQGNNRLKIKV